MNRRDLFRMLAAVPMIGGWFAEPVAAAPVSVVIPAPSPISLARMRDLLLPGLQSYGYEERRALGIDLDMQVDLANDCLLVNGYRAANGQSLGFAITRDSINKGHYKNQFEPCVLKLIDLLGDQDGVLTRAISSGKIQ